MLFSKSGTNPCLLTVLEHRTLSSFFHVYSLLLLYHLSNTLLMQLYESEHSTRMVFSVDCSSPKPRPTFSQSSCTLTPTSSIRGLVLVPVGLQILSKTPVYFSSITYIIATLRLNMGFGRTSCAANSSTSYKRWQIMLEGVNYS